MKSADIHATLLEAIRLRADALDGGILAPPWVRSLTANETIEAWQAVLEDSRSLAHHEPVDTEGRTPICAADREAYPCREVRRLAAEYEPGSGSHVARS